MPNKHSYACVLSDHEARGLIRFDGSRFPRLRPGHARTLKKPSTTDDVLTSQQYKLADPPSTKLPRLRLESPSPPPFSLHDSCTSPRRKRTNTNFTALTETYPRQASSPSSPSNTDTTVKDGQHLQSRGDRGAVSRCSFPQSPLTVDSRENLERQDQEPSNRRSCHAMMGIDDRVHVELEGHGAHGLRPRNNIQKRLSNETAIFSPHSLSTPPPTANRQPSHEASALGCFRHPPSPPLTPDQRESFSLDTSLDTFKPPPIESAAPSSSVPGPNRGIQGSMSDLPASSILIRSSAMSRPSSLTVRPKTSATTPERSSQILPNLYRTSSLEFLATRPFDHNELQASSSSNGMSDRANEHALVGEGDSTAEPLFAELEPLPIFSADFGESDLPTKLPSDLDCTISPWEDVSFNDTIHPALRHPSSPSISTRASSFDSVAPPPISLSRFNEPLSYRPKAQGPLPDRSRPETPPMIKSSENSKSQTSPHESLSAFLHGRSHIPISIAYHTTTSGKEPTYVSVSRTPVPSIPTLFSRYKGPWPPAKTPISHGGSSKASSSTTSSAKKTGLKAFPPSPASRGLATPSNPTSPSAVAPPASVFRQNGPAPVTPVHVQSKVLSDGPAPFAQVELQPGAKRVGPAVVRSPRPGAAAGETKQRRKSWFNTDTLDRTFGERERREGRRERRSSEIAPGLM